MVIDYRTPDFYMVKYRKQFEIIDKIKVNKIKTLNHVKDNYEAHLFSDGYVVLFNGKRYLKPIIAKGKDNYISYNVVTVDGKTFKLYMHRLVGLWLLDGYQDGYFVDHIDNDKSNNHISNLKWLSHKENTRKAVKDNRGVGRPKVANKPKKVYMTKLERSSTYSKITYDDVTKIFKMLDDGLSISKIAKVIGVSQPAISQIVKGKRWSDHPKSIEYRKMSLV